ncbi:hypothetical protein [Methylobacterium oxalidis]|nr:hypothetical protein [Methylobacterium oxalidis]GJE33275.1 hypothetical protein LDDCCGHA_3475 [Methylobacterium oxalidis]
MTTGAEAMPIYRLRVAWRERNGIVRAPISDESIEASNLRDAIAVALARPQQLLATGTNLAWIVDPEGHVAWTLRMDDTSAVAV